METDDASPRPFKALIAASSFFVVVLAVAGFSLRWTYYYNFGLQNIVIEAPLSSLAFSAVEIIREPENIVTLLRLGLEFLVPFEILLWVLQRLSRSPRPFLRRNNEIAAIFSGLRGSLFADVIRASLIVFVAFRAGGIAGFDDYKVNVVDGTSQLPRVTAIVNPADDAAKNAAFPFACDTRPLVDRTTPTAVPAFVGDPQTVTRINSGITCSSDTQRWRLLYKDDKFVYIFLTVTEYGPRPETLIIPNSDRLALVLQ
jgi:hypothetical protein